MPSLADSRSGSCLIARACSQWKPRHHHEMGEWPRDARRRVLGTTLAIGPAEPRPALHGDLASLEVPAGAVRAYRPDGVRGHPKSHSAGMRDRVAGRFPRSRTFPPHVDAPRSGATRGTGARPRSLAIHLEPQARAGLGKIQAPAGGVRVHDRQTPPMVGAACELTPAIRSNSRPPPAPPGGGRSLCWRKTPDSRVR